jgi:hypothetical protein
VIAGEGELVTLRAARSNPAAAMAQPGRV